ncbi:hypothetical protein THAOC_05249, partial [Thalassiosira oceanica]
ETVYPLLVEGSVQRWREAPFIVGDFQATPASPVPRPAERLSTMFSCVERHRISGRDNTTRLDEPVHTVEGNGITDAVRRRSGRDSCSVGRTTHVCGLGGSRRRAVGPLRRSLAALVDRYTMESPPPTPQSTLRGIDASGRPSGGGGSRFAARRCVDNGQIRGAFLLC